MSKLNNLLANLLIVSLLSMSLSGCARDLASNVYTSEDTVNLVLEGQILSSRNVIIKESDRLSDNTMGAGVGAIGGGVIGAQSSKGNAIATVGGAVVGGVIGAAAQSAFGTNKGIEYLVKVDNSKLQDGYFDGSRLMRNALSIAKATGTITVVQSKDKNTSVLANGTKVLVIINEKRVRVTAQ